MKTLTDYHRLITEAKNNPKQLAELGVQAAADYAFYSEQYAVYELKRAKFFDIVKFAEEKPLSDRACEAKWLLEEDGKKWLTIKRYLKGLEKINSAIKTLAFTSDQEARGTY